MLGCRFYQTSAKNEPVHEWLNGLARDVRKTIGGDIRAVQINWPIGKPLVDGFGKGLYEVRSTHADVEYRVLFCIVEGSMMLLHGFIKKGQKTPQRDIGLGRKRQKEVES